MGNSTFRYDQTYNLKNNTFEHKTKSFSGWKAMTKDVKGNKIWFYTNGTKSGWYKEGKQPKGWKKKVFKNKEKVTKLADNFEQYCNYGEVYMYAAWK